MSLTLSPIIRDLLGAFPTAVSGSMGADITSNYEEVIKHRRVSVQFGWSSGTSPVGVVSVQGSNDTDPATATWHTIAGLSLAVSGNSGSHLLEDPNCGYRWVRVIYTRTSGTATATIKLIAKEL